MNRITINSYNDMKEIGKLIKGAALLGGWLLVIMLLFSESETAGIGAVALTKVAGFALAWGLCKWMNKKEAYIPLK